MSELQKNETKKDMKLYLSEFIKNIKWFKANLKRVSKVKDNDDALEGFRALKGNLNNLYNLVSVLRLSEEHKLQSSISKLLEKMPDCSQRTKINYVLLLNHFEKEAQKFITENNLSSFDFNYCEEEQPDLEIANKRLEIQTKMDDEEFIKQLDEDNVDEDNGELGNLSTLRALVEDFSNYINSGHKRNIDKKISKIIDSLYAIGISSYGKNILREAVIDAILDLESLKKRKLTNENLKECNKVVSNVLENLNYAINLEFNKIDKSKVSEFFPKFAVPINSQNEIGAKSRLSWQRKAAAGAVVATSLGCSIYGVVEQFIRNNNWFASGSNFFTTSFEGAPSAVGDAVMALHLTAAVLVILMLLAVIVNPALEKTSSVDDENLVQSQNSPSVAANA